MSKKLSKLNQVNINRKEIKKSAPKNNKLINNNNNHEKFGLIEFYGTECQHCNDMEPLVKKLEAEFKLKVNKIEVWHNDNNARMMQKYDKGYCGGVPFFFNEKTGKWICGAVNYAELKKWAMS